MWLDKGQPKSLFRPGSSVDALIFQAGRVAFAADILSNLHHPAARSRYSQHFGRPLVETDVKVRSEIGRALGADPASAPENRPRGGRHTRQPATGESDPT
jgi:phosphatidylserine decarboxylase